MQNIGEEIAGEYLKIHHRCEFVAYNLQTTEVQGEIDVVGINIKEKHVYICEVVVHLETGMQYVHERQPDNVRRFTSKFSKGIEYADKYFDGYEKTFMLWSPIVKMSGEKAKNNQMKDIDEIVQQIHSKYGVTLEPVINKKYQEALAVLRSYAAKKTEELKSPVLRLMQIEEKLEKHLRPKKSAKK